MKRILSVILVFVLSLGCVLTFASCNSSENDKKEENKVITPYKDPEKAKKALEDAKYKVTFVEGEKIGDEKIEAIISAYSEDGKNMISIVYYAESADAKDAEKEAKDELEEMGDEAEDYEVGRSGKVVWMGTKDAIKIAAGKKVSSSEDNDFSGNGGNDDNDSDNNGAGGDIKDDDEYEFKIGFILLHDECSTYDLNFIEAAKKAQKELGLSDNQVIFKKNIPESNDCYEAAMDLVDEGCDIIFADSFGHEPYLLKAAKEIRM